MIGLNENDGVPTRAPSLAPRVTARLFADGGWLTESLGLEHRPQQETMARAVARAMADDEPLLFEAGTGTGKSLAYLLPGIIQAIDQTRPLVVSTHTIALQEQLDQKDLPLCRRVLSSRAETLPYADFKSTVLVGKGNYLCTSRLAQALRDKQELFSTPEHSELSRVAAWAETTKEGLRHELVPAVNPDVWESVSADSSQCSRKYCDPEKCFYQRARARVRGANVVIVNHSLLFALLNAGTASETGTAKGILFPEDFVVLDEAHTVPDVATDHFGMRLSSYGVDRLLRHLYNPKTKKGMLLKLGDAQARLAVGNCLEASQHFFAGLHERWLQKQPIVRVRTPEAGEPWLDEPLSTLHSHLRRLSDQLDEGREREELIDQAAKVRTCRDTIRNFLSLADESSVYWLERSGKRFQVVALRSAPIDIAPHLRETLLAKNTSVLFTSATLALAGQMGPFQTRIGAEAVRTGIVASPFDFERVMRVYVASDVPLPSAGEARLSTDVLAEYIRFCVTAITGGSLVLFTSYDDLRKVSALVEAPLREAGRTLLLQGGDQSRTELARQLRERGNAVLFGTESFWTGIDVPGDALAQVILTRLPFEVPSHPVLEARADWIRERGGNPFNELTLPDALVKFRQGVGRLIRTTTDRGVVTILDSRLLSKSYGRLFIACLPTQNLTRVDRSNRESLFQAP